MESILKGNIIVLRILYNKQHEDWLMQNTDDWPLDCATFEEEIDNHYPANKLVQLIKMHIWILQVVIQFSPIDGAVNYIHRWFMQWQCCICSK